MVKKASKCHKVWLFFLSFHFETDETDELVSMLDPHFKLLWTAPENTEELVSLLQKNSSSDEINSDTFSQNKKHKSDDFFNFLPKSTPKRKRHQMKAHNLYNVIWKHQPWNFKLLTFFWENKWTLISNFSKDCQKYLSVQDFSVPIERLFSVAWKIFKTNRIVHQHFMIIKFELIVNMNEPESEHELVDMLKCVSFIKHLQHS